MEVCLFGGSFDPVHISHQLIVNDLCEKFDEVWVIVAKNAPNKIEHSASFEDRFNMCKIAFKNSNVVILDIEHSNDFKYSFDTITYLKNKFDHKFSFAIGTDQLNNLYKWYKYDELIRLVDFVTFERKNFNYYNIERTMSSTIARITKDTFISDVNNYIYNNKLYVNKYDNDFSNIKDVVTIKRFYHIVNVYLYILDLANIFNLNIDECAMAAIYHDYYKDSLNSDNYADFKNEYPKYRNYPDVIMHGIIFAVVNPFKFDEKVIEAILYHSTGFSNASDINMALYLADYCEVSRKYHDEIQDIVKLSKIDLNLAYKTCVKRRSNWLIDNVGLQDDIYKIIKDIMEE